MLAASLRAGGRFAGSLNLAAGYDDSILQDATAVGGPFVSQALDLGFKGRAFRNLTASLAGHASNLNPPSVPSQNLVEADVQANLAWRFFDCLSPLLETSAQNFNGPQASNLDFNSIDYAGGLRIEFPTQARVEALAQNSDQRFPNTDLDHQDQGGEARLDWDLPANLRLKGRVQRTDRRYSKRHGYLLPTTLGNPPTALRQDLDIHWDTSLTWERDEAAVRLLARSRRLESNGDQLDYGPGQNAYFDLSFPLGPPGQFRHDDTVIANYFSQQTFGGELSAWKQWGAWNLAGHASLDDIQFLGRFAKGADDNFLPGNPLRHDQVIKSGLELSCFFNFMGLDWESQLAWTHWQALSNDSLYFYQRNLTQGSLSLLF